MVMRVELPRFEDDVPPLEDSTFRMLYRVLGDRAKPNCATSTIRTSSTAIRASETSKFLDQDQSIFTRTWLCKNHKHIWR